MKYSLNHLNTIPLALLLHTSLVNAEQPFVNQDIERRSASAECRIFEFTCATCGHIIDDEQWDKQNRLISDVEACKKQQAEQPLSKKPASDD